MRQQLSFESSPGNPTDGQFAAPLSGFPDWDLSTDLTTVNYCPIAITLTNIVITMSAAPGAGTSRIFTFVVNGVDTAAVLTIADAATSSATYTGTVTVPVAGLLTVRHNITGAPASATVTRVRLEFNTTTQNLSAYWAGGGTLNSTTPRYSTPLTSSIPSTTALAGGIQVVPIAGTFTRYYLRGTANAGGQSYTFTVYKNGVAQDGAGGTVNTAFTATPTASVTSVLSSPVFNLPVVPGDQLYIRSDRTSGSFLSMSLISLFESTSNFEFIASQTSSALGTSTNYMAPVNGDGQGAGTPESAKSSVGSTTRARYDSQYVYLTSAGPGTGNRTFTFRRNAGATSIVTGPLTGATQAGNDVTHGVNIDSGDTFATECAAASTPTDSPVSVSYRVVMKTQVPNVVGQTRAAAVAAVNAVGLREVIVEVPSPTVPVDEVISTDPPALDEVSVDSEVEITVSSGPSGAVGSGAARYTSRLRYGWFY